MALSGAVPEGERSRVADALDRLSLAPEELEARVAFEWSPGPYGDPQLRDGGDAYLEFVKDQRALGMATFELSCESEARIFFVLKKNGTLRLIVDARRANQVLRRPPRARLVSSSRL